MGRRYMIESDLYETEYAKYLFTAYLQYYLVRIFSVGGHARIIDRAGSDLVD